MDEGQARLVEILARYEGIERHPGWAALREDFARLQQEQSETLARRLLHGKGELDQREIDRFRGFWQGVDWILSRPAHAKDNLDRALGKTPGGQ